MKIQARRPKRLNVALSAEPSFSFRITPQLRERMRRHSHAVSWADVCRAAVEAELARLERGK